MPSESEMFKRNPVSYSIWLMPDSKVKDQLKNKILALGSDFGGPIFEPHVTLIGSSLGAENTLLQKTEIISKKISPFKIFFDGIAHFNEYFCSLFLKVKFSPQLNAARDLASTEIDWNKNDYLPHMSLIYGNYTLSEKEKMISTLGWLPDHFSVNSIFLAHNDEIRLKWKVIRGFPLTN